MRSLEGDNGSGRVVVVVVRPVRNVSGFFLARARFSQKRIKDLSLFSGAWTTTTTTQRALDHDPTTTQVLVAAS